MNADELKTLLGLTLHFEAQFDRLANPLRDLVERSCLCMTSRKLRDGGDVVSLLVALYDDIKLAWHQLSSNSILRDPFLHRARGTNTDLDCLRFGDSGRTVRGAHAPQVDSYGVLTLDWPGGARGNRK